MLGREGRSEACVSFGWVVGRLPQVGAEEGKKNRKEWRKKEWRMSLGE
jgi:hypothetical protein